MPLLLLPTLLNIDKATGARGRYIMYGLQFAIVNMARNERPDDPRHTI